MLSHSMITTFVCIISLICIYYSLCIPWARPVVPVSHGLYEISVPMEIGLLECFSDICHKYKDLQHFLFHHKIELLSSENPFSDNSTSLQLTGEEEDVGGDKSDNEAGETTYEGIRVPLPRLPRRIKVPALIASPIEREKRSIERFLMPYQTASIAVLSCLSIACLLSTTLLLLLLYETCTKLLLITNNLKNILLLADAFSLFLSVILYLSLTYTHLNGGMYIDGVWIAAYSSVIGLLCCLLVNILDNNYEAERIHQSVDIYIQRHSPQRLPRHTATTTMETKTSLTEESDGRENKMYYQYELVPSSVSAFDEEGRGGTQTTSGRTTTGYQTPPRRR